MGGKIIFSTPIIEVDKLISKSPWPRKIYTQYEQSRADIFRKVQDYAFNNNLGSVYEPAIKGIIDQKSFDLLFGDDNE